MELKTTDELQAFIRATPLSLVYFSAPDCGVCKALWPKLEALLQDEYPGLAYARVDCGATPEVAAQYQIFAVPSTIVFAEGREAFRQVRHLSIAQLRELLERPYHLLWGDKG